MIRGLRGATTVKENNETQILHSTKQLIEEMVEINNVSVDMISHVFISVTKELDAVFPAKALRQLPDWTFVPVMCMKEIDVPGSLANCIRVMMVINTTVGQDKIKHVFHNEAIQLRPDLIKNVGEVRG